MLARAGADGAVACGVPDPEELWTPEKVLFALNLTV
jgi:hypothetical protein